MVNMALKRLHGSFPAWKDLRQGLVFGSQLLPIYFNDLEKGAKYKAFRFDDDAKVGERACCKDDIWTL